MTEFKERIGKMENIKKEDFRNFIDDNFYFEGCEVGYYLRPDLCEEGFAIHFNNLDIFNIFKEEKKEEYQSLVEEYGEEKIDRFEEILEKADGDARYNNSYYVSFYEEYQEELAEILDDYYSKNEDEIDNKVLYEAREEIKKETLRLIEEEK